MTLRIHPPDSSSREAFGPFRTYIFTRGLTLTLSQDGAAVSDGVGSSLCYPTSLEANEFGLLSNEEYYRLVSEVEDDLGIKFVGFAAENSVESAFKLGQHTLSSSWVGEELLGKLQTLESLVRKRVLDTSSITAEKLDIGRNICAALEDDISYGKVGPVPLEKAIDSYRKVGVPIDEAYFVHNAAGIADDMRHLLSSACYHFTNLNSRILKINRTEEFFLSEENCPTMPWERRLSSTAVDELSHEYTGSVVACYSALDLLYILFVYLTREPYMNPAFPRGLHFPDSPRHRVFQNEGTPLPSDPPARDFPYAIANLTPGQFGTLRNTRNALVHNMSSDSIRPRVYKGWKQPPVNNKPLQYVQYLAMDIEEQGNLVTHPWVRRFYEKQSDAQNSLLEWIELTWQCAFDTIEWLIKRWSAYLVSS